MKNGTWVSRDGSIEVSCSLLRIVLDGNLFIYDEEDFDVTPIVSNQHAALKELETSREYIQHRRFHKSGLCPLCPPRGGENARREPAHPAKKPRYKQHRRV